MLTKGVIRACCAVLFVASLQVPALHFDDRPPLFGADILPVGWWGVLLGEYAWYANPAFALALILEALGWARVSLLFASLAAVLAGSSFVAAGWYFDTSGVTEIHRFGFGFYLWLLAMLCPLLLHAAHPPRTQEWDAE